MSGVFRGDEPSRTNQLTWADVVFRLIASAFFAFVGVTLCAGGAWVMDRWPADGSSFFAIWRSVWALFGGTGLLIAGFFFVALSVSALGSKSFPRFSDAASGDDHATARHPNPEAKP